MAPPRVPQSRHLVSGLLMAAFSLTFSGCAAHDSAPQGEYPQLLPMDEILAQAGVAPASP